MEERLKKRLIGAAVLASLAVIFVPMLVEKRTPPAGRELALPRLPAEAPPRPVPFETPVLRPQVPAPEPVPETVEPMAEEPVETEVPTAQTPRAALSGWVVRVGSFSNRENAARLVEKLRAAGLDTMDPQPVELRGRTLYRVQVGPEVDRRRAEGLLPRIKELTRLDGQVRSYP